MSSIYELQGAWKQLQLLLEDGVIDEQTFSDTLESVEYEIELKADAYAMIITNLKPQAAALKEEAKRLTERANAIENNMERMKHTLEKVMVDTGKTKFKTDKFSFNIQKNPASVVLAQDLDINTVPAEFLKFAEPTVNKKAVAEAIANGEKFDWAEVVQSEGLRFR